MQFSCVMVTDTPFLVPVLMRDFAEGLQQQMFFLGQDVIHPDGNLLVKRGFERSASTGIKGTSCYRCSWQGGHIELYGSCAGWYRDVGDDVEGGFCFIRPWRRAAIWLTNKQTPIPGAWQKEFFQKKPSRKELYLASLPFLDWLISHEEFVLETYGKNYREANYDAYKKVPNARAWVSPDVAISWFKAFRDRPERLVRPKKMGAVVGSAIN